MPSRTLPEHLDLRHFYITQTANRSASTTHIKMYPPPLQVNCSGRDLDLWPWKPFQQWPVTWWISAASFTEIPPLSTVDHLIAYKGLLTDCHICFHQKNTTLAYVLEVIVIHCLYVCKLCKSSFITRRLFCFLLLLTVFSITIFTVLFYYNICVCHLF